MDYVRRHVPDRKPVYHHVDFPVIDELPIEVHFTPSWMNSPFTNRRLQDFFKRGTGNVERGTRGHACVYDNVNENENCHPDGNSKHYTLNSKQNQPLAELENQQSETAINQRPEGAINRAKGTLTGTEGAYSKQI